jgi:MATE family multidrug resistance protein
VLNNFLLVSAFFLDGLANAAQQLCGRSFGARDARGFADSTRLVLAWGLGFALVVAVLFGLFGPNLIDVMTASEDVRRAAREFLPFIVLAPLPGVFAFGFDGIYVGATWAREMRNLMLASLAIFFGIWLALQSLGNAGLWSALVAFYVARGGLQGARYPALFRMTFSSSPRLRGEGRDEGESPRGR